MLARRAVVGSPVLQPYSLRSHRKFGTDQNLARRLIMVSAEYKVYVKGDPDQRVLGDCPFCHRVLLALETKKLTYDKDYIDFSRKPQWLQDKAQGKVPLLQDGDDYIPDSGAIVQYLDDKHPDPKLVTGTHADWGANIFGAFRGFLKSEPAESADKEAELRKELQKLDDQLKSMEGPYIGGDTLSDTDCSLAPKLYHLSIALPHFKNWEIPAEYGAVKDYLQRMQQTPQWKASYYSPELVIKGWSSH